MQGLILAAGMGRRLKELTSDNTKCMVKVNEVTLIDRALHQLDALGLSKIVIVVGYEGQKLINPDNPSGNYIGKAELLRIADWCEAKGIRMIADESFADFADEEDNSLIDEAILNAHPHLVVVKSISKSYGVPGIRLGVLASADEALIACMKKDAAIWNINSFGEFYMQIAEKYVKNYAAALRKFKATRKTMGEALGGIPALRVIPSQANYFMLELTGNVSARELTRRLLTEHDILVKDLSAKLAQSGRQYVRVAVRTEEDNARLIAALKEILK